MVTINVLEREQARSSGEQIPFMRRRDHLPAQPAHLDRSASPRLAASRAGVVRLACEVGLLRLDVVERRGALLLAHLGYSDRTRSTF